MTALQRLNLQNNQFTALSCSLDPRQQNIPLAAKRATQPDQHRKRRPKLRGLDELHTPRRDVRFFRELFLGESRLFAQTPDIPAQHSKL